MKKSISQIIVLFLFFVITEVSLTGCANMIPPGGGAKDTIPPTILTAVPKDSSINFKGNKIVLTFNEYIEVKDVSNNLIVSPLPKNNPIVDYKLKTITIKLRDSLEPNTTYSFNFGNSIVDVNESNPAQNFSYVFSTGNEIDNYTFSGKVIVAETGAIDSSLIAVLYNNTQADAVIKEKPRYITKVKGDGSFSFHHLPKGVFALYAMPNDYAKKYDDSTKLFAFADSLIYTSSTTKEIVLYAYQEAKQAEKPSTTTVVKSKNDTEKSKQIKFTTSLDAGKQDILSNQLSLNFITSLVSLDSTKIILTDTNDIQLANYSISTNSNKTKIFINTEWKENTPYQLQLSKQAFTDSLGNTLTKNDTIKFWTKQTSDYGSVKIRFNNLDTAKYPVLLIYQHNELIESIKITNKELNKKLFKPGEYALKILLDKNNNGIWDAGKYTQKLQPEIVYILSKKLVIRANWDNESEITLK